MRIPLPIWLGLLLGLVGCNDDSLIWSRLKDPPTLTEVRSAGLLIGPTNAPVERVLILNYGSRGCRKCQRLLEEALTRWRQEVEGGRLRLRVVLGQNGKPLGGLFCMATQGKIWNTLEDLRQNKMPPECPLDATKRQAEEKLLNKAASTAPGVVLLVYSEKSLQEAWELR